jgi:hypothetical protein
MNTDNYTYPQFIIDEKTRQIKINLIDKASGRVVRHIAARELDQILRDYYSPSGMGARKNE